MLSVSNSVGGGSSKSLLEEMLDSLQRADEKPKDIPPALPARPKPTPRARLPSFKRLPLPSNFDKINNGFSSDLDNLSKVEVVENIETGVLGKDQSFGVKGSSEMEPRLPMPSNFDKINNGFSSDLDNLSKVDVVENIETRVLGKDQSFGVKRSRETEPPPSKSESPYFEEEENEFEPRFVDSQRDGYIDYFINKKLRVWCHVKDDHWEIGKIQSAEGKKASVLLLNNGNVVSVQPGDLLPANPEILEGVDDLIQLSYLNEPSVVHNLQHRFFRDIIYSKAGAVLVAINPFKDVQLYGDEYVTSYRQNLVDSPHVYAVADSAYTAMMRDELNQSIIISGESGAGKTETAKVAMEYMAAISGGTSGITYELLQASFIILEAFGNAKTSRNDNSNRLGKLIEMHFTEKGIMCGAKIETFLLEKSRIVGLANGERSYHVFYQLCAGAPSDIKETLKLKKASDFKYLNRSDCFNVDDTSKFHLITKALDTLKIRKEDQENVFEMLAAVLWLGNISFQVIDNENHAEVVHDEAVTNACKLIGCTDLKLVQALSTRTIQVGNNIVFERLTLQQALDTRDALAMFLYSSMFDWLVKELNIALAMDKHYTGRSICIVDMYGFESSKENTLVDSVNERFQQQFYRHLLKLDQEEYESDGIDWTKRPNGLISLSDEESSFPEAIKFQQLLNGSPCFKGERSGAFNARYSSGEGKLLKLMQHLEKTTLHFICCIKPNNKQLPGVFEKDVVLKQLRCLQVLEVVKIARSGYPTQMTHEEFSSRYGLLLPGYNDNQDPLSTSVAILQQFGIRPEMYRVGFKKIYLRAGQVDILEDTRKQAQLGSLEVQDRFHGRQTCHNFSELRESVITLQSFIRREIGRVQLNILRQRNSEKQLKAVVQIQSAIRGWLARKNFGQLRDSIIVKNEERKHVKTLADLMSMDPQNLPPSADVLKKRVTFVGAELRKEEKENDALREQVQQLEARLLEKEANMKSIEETRQKQIATLQMSLTAARRSPGADHQTAVRAENPELSPPLYNDDSEETMSGGSRTPSRSTPARLAINGFESTASGLETNGGSTSVRLHANGLKNKKQNLEIDAESISKAKSVRNDEEEYRNLKQKFDAWKKDYKIRLKELKSKLHRLGRSEGESGRMKWWGRKSKKV